MDLLINELEQNHWATTASNFNGSSVFEVRYGNNDEKLIFWNDSSDSSFDKDDACQKIAELIGDEGLDIMNNSVDINFNTICFEVHDNNY